ncbi:16S rRNA (guanine527-N7)-methyltransferase [Kribbella orskensis]|uniref:Ribosomal RNA small subunit methyltransferase G n=1 Tax=Kribbella orskensis TaxID=2512216 RepID=A0ABY2BRR5_9ACTN|nr:MULTISPECIES: 16S rRNA (guanine(527)-N(7))-methyltransferase RsmG [Kribbella]TCN39555.1 16S rRNA (guanine527-N7)-methyltransferase [Kribbella sp. VKM Ac-2500]TCO27663.1 16S rRNA (guanine527-N7)-methyltransferase [Kribbella orskensis]
MEELFPRAVDRLAAYADLLATEGTLRGLIGPREVPRLWDRHLLNCAVLERLIPEESTVADIGTGAGLPGIVLALVRPDLQVALVEPLLRRTTFLQEAVEMLGCNNAEVVRSRAEDLPAASYDVVTSRAVAPLGKLAAWCLPLVVEGGLMLAMKGASVEEELAASERELQALGAEEWHIHELGVDELAQPTTVVSIVAGRAARGSQHRRRGR